MPASAQYEQNVSNRNQKAEGYHCVPQCAETAILNSGSGWLLAGHWLRVRER